MTHQAEITSAHLETIYRILLKRIAKGYTAERLSFLIGKDHSYIEQVESLQLPLYSGEELELLALALEESNTKSFYASVHDETRLKVAVVQHKRQNKLSHSYFTIGDDQEERLLFLITEDLFGDFDEQINSDENYEIAVDAVKLLIRSGYFFEAKIPLEILQSVNQFLTDPLDAFYIESAMMKFSNHGQTEGPLRKVQKEMSSYLYEEC